MKGVGNGGVSGDGLVFLIDSLSLPSYNPGDYSDMSGSESYIPYYGTTPSITLNLSGNSTDWVQYMTLNGYIDLYLSGGAIDETYRVNSVTYDQVNDITILHQHGTVSSTLTYSCVMDNTWSGGPWFVKIPNFDLSVSLKIYAAEQNNQLTLSLFGGADSYGTLSSIYSASITDLSFNSINIVAFSGDSSNTWNNYVVPYSGNMPLYLSGGAITETYIIGGAVYNGTIGETYLCGFTTSSTYSVPCTNFTSWGPNFPIIVGQDMQMIFSLYSSGNTVPLSLYLSGGAISEVFNAENFYFDGVNTIIYDNTFVGTLYTDHTQFEIFVPGLVPTLYTDHITATYTSLYATESYIVQNFYFDGTHTYIYDNSYIGTLSEFHTNFTINAASIIGTNYDDHTYFTFSHPTLPPKSVINRVDDNNQKIVVSYSLVNGVSYNKRDFIFDGIDDYINVGNLSGISGDFTLNIWYNSSSIVDYKNLLDFNGGNTMLRIEQYSLPGYFAGWSNPGAPGSGRARMSVIFNLVGDGSFGFGGDYPPYTLDENTWYNLVAIFDNVSKYARVFINGVKYIDQNVPNAWPGYINNFRIGDGYDYSSRRFQGTMPYVAIYNRPLSDDEVINSYNSLKWRFK